MRRILWWFAGTVTVLVLMLGYHTSTAGTGPTVGAQPAIVSNVGSTSSSTTSSSTSSSSSTGTSKSGSAKAKTSAKTVTGDVANTQWGPVQVQLKVSGGTITQVAVVQYPNGNGRDQEINSYALPILVKETTQAQSAKIDMVSGATVTSGGYLQSLQSALDKASL